VTRPRRLVVAGLLATAVVACHPSSGAAARSDASTVDLSAFPARVNPEIVGGLVLYMGGGEGSLKESLMQRFAKVGGAEDGGPGRV